MTGTIDAWSYFKAEQGWEYCGGISIYITFGVRLDMTDRNPRYHHTFINSLQESAAISLMAVWTSETNAQ